MPTETPAETEKRVAWMREHFKLGDKAPFAECHDVTQRVLREKLDNQRLMTPPLLPLSRRPSLAACDGLVAMANVSRDRGRK